MAITKSRTSIWFSQTLTAGDSDTSSLWRDLSSSYDTTVNIKITNGSTGPTDPAQVQVMVVNYFDGDNPASPRTEYAVFEAGTDSNEEYDWVVHLPAPIQAFKLVAGSNTGQDVTIDADYCEVTAL